MCPAGGDRLTDAAAPFRIVEGRHGRFAALAGDRTIARAIELTGGFAEGEARLLAALLRPGDVAVDCGANIGAVAVPLARKVGPAGRILAFEPMRLPFLCLCATAVLNGLPQIDPRRQALGAMPGDVALPDLDPTAPGNHGALSLLGATGGERAQVVTLDSLRLLRLALLKIDAEGMDWAVLQGARETIARCRPALYVEAGRDIAARAAAIRALQAEGWRWWWHFAWFAEPGTLPPGMADPFDHAGDANLLALPPGHRAQPRLASVSAPDADWRADIAAHRA
ncbi:FkbM family methyltransferase, partial [Falsiroseomonas oryzae]|uniref:FkbM family methyltransferase n=1 Tax=Falsiroseomonas oryzae TaxID=2766473 RepID=UPI0022EB378A